MTAQIIAAQRSPVAPRGGALSQLEIHQLAAPIVTACLSETGISSDEVDELIVSNALGAGGNSARLIALAAKLPDCVAGLTIDRQCAGGLDALLLAKALIESGQAKIVIAGGVESYSRAPLRFRTFADGRTPEAYSQPPFTPWPDRDPLMDEAADALGTAMGISRSEQDQWAIDSHHKAQRSIPNGIVPVAGLGHDSFTRPLSPKICSRAKVLNGNITAANAAVAADAAAFCLVVAPEVADRIGAKGIRFSGATKGNKPEQPGLGPVPAIQQVLSAEKLTVSQLTLVELMEAYAVQAIACARETNLPLSRVNTHGGALARGHPIGASGTILAVQMFHQLRESGGTGLAAIAAAGGIGTALIMRS